ncbi:hypothetical protein [Bradyrhizobium sp.]
MIDKSPLLQAQPCEPNWIWRSYPGTTEKGTFSILAAAEVLLAVGAYWLFSLWAHTHLHLLAGVVVAPFLLLRSEQSTALGQKWFKAIDISFGDSYSPLGRLLANIPNFKINWLKKPFGFLNFPIRAIVGISLYAIIAPLCLGIAFVIRIVATVCYLVPGVTSLSSNWWRTLFATDIFTRPEIVPGHKASDSIFHFDEFVATPREAVDYASGLQNTFANKYVFLASKALFVLFVTVICVGAYVIIFGPSYLYRMSIKSTAWVHWPLAYVSRPLRYAGDPEEVRMRLWNDPREWLRRAAMIITLSGALVASIPSLASIKTAFPAGVISIVEYAVLIDVRSLFAHPWRVVALISATITLVLSWYGFELSLLVKRSAVNPDRLISAGNWAAALEYAMRLRDVCGWTFWLLVFVHAVLWFTPSTTWLTGYPREMLQFIYGDYFPPD